MKAYYRQQILACLDSSRRADFATLCQWCSRDDTSYGAQGSKIVWPDFLNSINALEREGAIHVDREGGKVVLVSAIRKPQQDEERLVL